MRYKINVMGKGVFGRFFEGLIQLNTEAELSSISEADTVVLAVPSHAFDDATKSLSGRHVVNVCSVQSQTNKICIENGCHTTGLHPLFGPRTPPIGRKWIMTNECLILNERRFRNEVIGSIAPYTVYHMNAEEHDRIMAQTHLKFVRIMEVIKPMLDDCTLSEREIEMYAPNSFKQLFNLVDSLGDMPEGTMSSIKANIFGD